MNVSLDGYTVDANGDLGWSTPDDELHQYWNDRTGQIALSLYGRKLNPSTNADKPLDQRNTRAVLPAANPAPTWLNDHYGPVP
ncbi:hypothetical protein [Saccharothrix sp. HUAS TT1]|uniref:hypothetical protein n=1 Tax=unclassified Saccharothrix TaxID=2593673 RepID=UPI00345BF503